MRCRTLVVATSPLILSAALACESERPIADDLLRLGAGEPPGGAGGQGSEDASIPCEGATTDASAPDQLEPDASGPAVCE